jgi:hypothetical protein
MAESKLERVSVIVKENLDADPLEKAIAELYGRELNGSSVGVKFTLDGELYGALVRFKQSTLSVPEVVETLNELFESVLKEVEENGRS